MSSPAPAPRPAKPDFGTLVIRYIAADCCVELKSLKLYLQSYRNRGIFYEDVTNVILDDLVACVAPRWMHVQSDLDRARWHPFGHYRRAWTTAGLSRMSNVENPNVEGMTKPE